MQHQVVIGSGPVGSGVASTLAARGVPVTVVTRRGSGPDHPLVTKVRADAADADALAQLCSGASAVYNCANPQYHRWATDWPPIHRSLMNAAERSGAVLVMTDNLYAFGPNGSMPMAEDDQLLATGTKGGMRATMAREMLEAHRAGRLRATIARASDYYGPEVLGAALGERVMPRVLAGKKVTLLGSLDVPHSMSYMPDVVNTLVTIAGDERAWGRPWHVPNAEPLTQRQWVAALASAAGTEVKVAAVPKTVLRLMGVFVPMMRELRETWYQFALPWVTDSSLTEQTFTLAATPVADATAATVAWWRDRQVAR